MDPLQYLSDYRGKEIELSLVHGERLYGVLIAADDHGNVVLHHIPSSLSDAQNDGDTGSAGGYKRRRTLFHGVEESVRFIRGSMIKAISSFD